jgi:carboxylesterase type B
VLLGYAVPVNDLKCSEVHFLFQGTPIIYVNFNYRLGPLGFPQGQEADNRGALNLGIKDQITALQWVQLHIETFGGDKDKVLAMSVTSYASTQTTRSPFSAKAQGQY